MNVWFTVIISAIRFFIFIDAMKTINFKFYERNFFFSDFFKNSCLILAQTNGKSHNKNRTEMAQIFSVNESTLWKKQVVKLLIKNRRNLVL